METDNTVERQRQLAAEGLRRHRAIGAGPATPNATPTTAPEAKQTEDATLNWAGGPPMITPSGPRDVPFTPALRQVAGVGSVERASYAPPQDFGRDVTPAPDGRRGGCMTFEEIMKYGGR